MSRMKTMSRTENRAAIANLVDLGFTPSTIAYMTSKNPVTIYALLERMGRKKGKTIVRNDPTHIDPQAYRYMQRLFVSPEHVVPHLWGVARTSAHFANGHAKPMKKKARG